VRSTLQHGQEILQELLGATPVTATESGAGSMSHATRRPSAVRMTCAAARRVHDGDGQRRWHRRHLPTTTGTVSVTAIVDDVNRIPEINEGKNQLVNVLKVG
jgi:hypothetical protein